MLPITSVGSAAVGLRGAAPGACGGALGFLALGFFSFLSEDELAGLALEAESGRTARGEAGLAMGLAIGLAGALMASTLWGQIGRLDFDEEGLSMYDF